jgi:hypothetical protein
MPGAPAHLPRPGTYSPVSNSSTAAACRFVRAAQMSFRLIGCACRIMRIAPKEACLASGRTTTSGLFPDLEQSRMPTPRRFGKKPPNGHVSPHTSPTPTSAPAKPWTATAPNGHVSPHTSPTPTSAPAKPWTATAPNRHDSAHTSPTHPGAGQTVDRNRPKPARFRAHLTPAATAAGTVELPNRRHFVHRSGCRTRSSRPGSRHWARFPSARTVTQSGSHGCGSMGRRIRPPGQRTGDDQADGSGRRPATGRR